MIAGINKVGDKLLCISHSPEMYCQQALIASKPSDISAFIDAQLFAGSDDDAVAEILQDLMDHDWEDGPYTLDLEDGGLRFEDCHQCVSTKLKMGGGE